MKNLPVRPQGENCFDLLARMRRPRRGALRSMLLTAPSLVALAAAPGVAMADVHIAPGTHTGTQDLDALQTGSGSRALIEGDIDASAVGEDGVTGSAQAWQVENRGRIEANEVGIRLDHGDGDSVYNHADGEILTQYYSNVALYNGGRVENAGKMHLTSSYYNIFILGDGSALNSGELSSNYVAGVLIHNGDGQISNAGKITAGSGARLEVTAIDNSAISTRDNSIAITNSGEMKAGDDARLTGRLEASTEDISGNNDISLINTGILLADDEVDLRAEVVAINGAISGNNRLVIENSGLIEADDDVGLYADIYAVYGGGVSGENQVEVVNSGTIKSDDDVRMSAFIDTYAGGIGGSNQASIVNTGAVDGGDLYLSAGIYTYNGDLAGNNRVELQLAEDSRISSAHYSYFTAIIGGDDTDITGNNTVSLTNSGEIKGVADIRLEAVMFAGYGSGVITGDNTLSLVNTGRIESDDSISLNAFAVGDVLSGNNSIELINRGALESGNHIYMHAGAIGDASAGKTQVRIENSGSIKADGDVLMIGAHDASDEQGVVLLNSGSITAGSVGIGTYYGRGQILNTGSIVSDGATYLFLVEGGSIDNSGTIEAGRVVAEGGAPVEFANSGQIVLDQSLRLDGEIHLNNSGSIVSETDAGVITAAGTDNEIINSGHIGGGSGTAVRFDGGTNLLELHEGWSLDGIADGGGGNSTLRLKGGNLTGADFASFDLVELDGGRLSGTITITGDVHNRAGTVAPGNSIGTLQIAGNYTQGADARLEIEVDGAGNSDVLDITGTADLQGGTLVIQGSGGSFGASTQYTFLTAGGGVSGAFDEVDSQFAFLTAAASVGADDVSLTLTRDFSAGSQDGSANQQGVAAALDAAGSGGTAEFEDAVALLAGLDRAQGGAGLDQLSGELHTAVSSVGLKSGDTFIRSLMRQLRLAENEATVSTGQSARSDNGYGRSGWISLDGDFGKIDGNRNSHKLSYDTYSLSAGFDQRHSDSLRVGGGAGYSKSSFDLSGLRGDGDLNSYQLGGYGRYSQNRLNIDAMAGVAFLSYDLTRRMNVGGLGERSKSDGKARQLLLATEASYALPELSKGMSATPYLRLQLIDQRQKGLSESGAMGLKVGKESARSMRSVLGSRFTWQFADSPVQLSGDVGWAHEFADTKRQVNASFNGAPGTGFRVKGAELKRDSLLLGLGVQSSSNKPLRFAANYQAEINGDGTNHAIGAKMNYNW